MVFPRMGDGPPGGSAQVTAGAVGPCQMPRKEGGPVQVFAKDHVNSRVDSRSIWRKGTVNASSF